jgi:two-component system response regulator FlrC
MRVKYILVADGDRHFRTALFTTLTRLGHGVELAEDGQEALTKFQDQKFDLLMVDTKLSKLSGLALIKETKRIRLDLPVIAMSSGGGVDEAISVMREGAQDYLLKPFPAETVEEAIKRVCGDDEVGEAVSGLQKSDSESDRPIVAKSLLMERLLGLAIGLGGSTATVLLQGESGTGKELLARFIHRNSSRADGPFVAVNCAGLPESLLESELFGHEKGAFTGALAKKLGKFDLAHGGTILLDEISEMDISLQAKLLRALQEGEIDPVGGKGPHKIDVRVIATTNRKLKSWVDEGRFRADLYYRLNVMPFYIPALRERAEDIDVLAQHFVEKYAVVNHKNIEGLTTEAMEILKNHDWPGNIRELENTIARAVLMSRSEVLEAHDIFMDEAGFMVALERNAINLSQEKRAERKDGQTNGGQVHEANNQTGDFNESSVPGDESYDSSPSLENVGEVAAMPLMTIEDMERCLIGRALHETSGNRTHAAKLLGISVRTLRNKLAEYRTSGEIEDLMSASG